MTVTSVDVRDCVSKSLELGTLATGRPSGCSPACCTSTPSTHSVASGEGQATGEEGAGPRRSKGGCSNLQRMSMLKSEVGCSGLMLQVSEAPIFWQPCCNIVADQLHAPACFLVFAAPTNPVPAGANAAAGAGIPESACQPAGTLPVAKVRDDAHGVSLLLGSLLLLLERRWRRHILGLRRQVISSAVRVASD